MDHNSCVQCRFYLREQRFNAIVDNPTDTPVRRIRDKTILRGDSRQNLTTVKSVTDHHTLHTQIKRSVDFPYLVDHLVETTLIEYGRLHKAVDFPIALIP